MELVSIILGIIVAAGAGFFIGKGFSKESQEKSRLEQELQDKQAELDAFRNKVTNHFEKTADLFNQVSDSYQSLYDHIASSSNQLCSAPSFQTLPKSEQDALESKQNPVHANAGNSEHMFDANKLYNAHDYRNQAEEQVEEETPIVDSDKVVDIETAKEDRNEPALDYAVKKDGVINHNSLDVDGVKTS
ncbi:MAG: YhcB family protein [Kangiellaceae bacterium]|nr:YhcB family protein [Kangiellaceae bacterium]